MIDRNPPEGISESKHRLIDTCYYNYIYHSFLNIFNFFKYYILRINLNAYIILFSYIIFIYFIFIILYSLNSQKQILTSRS